MAEWATLEGLGLAEARLRSLASRGSFCREGCVTVQFCHFRQDDSKHHVVLLTGWDESFIKYGDVISDLLAAGFCVYTMDWRSQGLSGRHLLDPQVTYVKSFDDYLEDFKFFVDQIVVGRCNVDPSSLTCLAHSMGGFISLMAAADGWAKSKFQRLVVCSPMIKMKVGMPHGLARRLGCMLCRLGLGESYAPGQGGIDVFKPVKGKLTTDKNRLTSHEKIRRVFPLIAMGGMSNRWVVEAIKAQEWFAKHNGDVDIPVLLLEADDDSFVCTCRPFSKLCRLAKDCRRIHYPTTYHEILFEKNWARDHAMKTSIEFLKTGVRPPDQLTVVQPPPRHSSAETGLRRLCTLACRPFFASCDASVSDAVAAEKRSYNCGMGFAATMAGFVVGVGVVGACVVVVCGSAGNRD